jgi:hypothetical protein
VAYLLHLFGLRRAAAAAVFFSHAFESHARGRWFVEGTIWKHLWITLFEAMLAFASWARLARLC